MTPRRRKATDGNRAHPVSADRPAPERGDRRAAVRADAHAVAARAGDAVLGELRKPGPRGEPGGEPRGRVRGDVARRPSAAPGPGAIRPACVRPPPPAP